MHIMKTLRPLLYIIALMLIVVFIFQNPWLWNQHTIAFKLFTLHVVSVAEIPIWVLLVSAFMLGYILAWTVGRYDAFVLRRQLRASRRQMDAGTAPYPPSAPAPIDDTTLREGATTASAEPPPGPRDTQ
jgi:uncharacterized integral membrane protein